MSIFEVAAIKLMTGQGRSGGPPHPFLLFEMIATMTSYFNNMNISVGDNLWMLPTSLPAEWSMSRMAWFDATWFDATYAKTTAAASSAWIWTRDNVLIDNLDRLVYNGTMKGVNWAAEHLRTVQMPSVPGPSLTAENALIALGMLIFVTWVLGTLVDLYRLRKAIDAKTSDDPINGVTQMEGFTKPRRERIVTRSMSSALDREILALLPPSGSTSGLSAKAVFLALREPYPFITPDMVKSRLYEMRDASNVASLRERRVKTLWQSTA